MSSGKFGSSAVPACSKQRDVSALMEQAARDRKTDPLGCVILGRDVSIEVIKWFAVDLDVGPQLALLDARQEPRLDSLADDLDDVEHEVRRAGRHGREIERTFEPAAFGVRRVKKWLLGGDLVPKVVRHGVDDEPPPVSDDPERREPAARDDERSGIGGRDRQIGLAQAHERSVDHVEIVAVGTRTRAPLKLDEESLDGLARNGVAAEVEPRNVGPGKRDVAAVDREFDLVGVNALGPCRKAGRFRSVALRLA